MKLKDKIALVTGAGEGMGRAIALRLAQEGAHVVVNDINENSMVNVSREIEKLGRQSLAVKADVSKSSEVNNMFQQVFAEFNQLDILVNNAGIPEIGLVTELTEKRWDRVFSVNVKSVFLCSQKAAIQMIRQKKGRIINASSTVGLQGMKFSAHYSASKFAVIGFTQGLAKELAPYRITVNAYCPGLVVTRHWDYGGKELSRYLHLRNKEECIEYFARSIPLQRTGKPEDIAGLVSFLASDDASWITGQAFAVNGGEFMH